MKRVLPIVTDAAKNGHAQVSITTQARELYAFAEYIGKDLFARGIHSVHATPREFTIYICSPPTGDWSNSFSNPDYQTDDEDEAPIITEAGPSQ